MHFAQALDIRILAEGVETQEELAVLRAAGVSLFQGYLFAKPELGALPEVSFSDTRPARSASGL
jgi:EAL domain-containing protein (putative c-di-GMP-specific phosphodiesterase class I)